VLARNALDWMKPPLKKRLRERRIRNLNLRNIVKMMIRRI